MEVHNKYDEYPKLEILDKVKLTVNFGFGGDALANQTSGYLFVALIHMSSHAIALLLLFVLYHILLLSHFLLFKIECMAFSTLHSFYMPWKKRESRMVQ